MAWDRDDVKIKELYDAYQDIYRVSAELKVSSLIIKRVLKEKYGIAILSRQQRLEVIREEITAALSDQIKSLIGNKSFVSTVATPAKGESYRWSFAHSRYKGESYDYILCVGLNEEEKVESSFLLPKNAMPHNVIKISRRRRDKYSSYEIKVSGNMTT